MKQILLRRQNLFKSRISRVDSSRQKLISGVKQQCVHPVSGSPAGSTDYSRRLLAMLKLVTCSRADMRAHQSQCESVLHIGSEIGKNGSGKIPKAWTEHVRLTLYNKTTAGQRHFKTINPVTHSPFL